MAQVTVTIDGKQYQAPKGANLLLTCLKLGEGTDGSYPDQNEGGEHYVPHFCYHPGLSVSGSSWAWWSRPRTPAACCC